LELAMPGCILLTESSLAACSMLAWHFPVPLTNTQSVLSDSSSQHHGNL